MFWAQSFPNNRRPFRQATSKGSNGHSHRAIDGQLKEQHMETNILLDRPNR
jgi:hypothetical protein